MSRVSTVLAALLASGVAAQGAAARPAVSCGPLGLSDATAEAGIAFLHRRGASGAKHLPETMGSGSAWLDYDGDGWLDLYLVQSGSFPPDGGESAANRLYRNLGDGTFADVTARAGAGDRGYGQGATAADVDGDGDEDLYVTNFGADALLLNRGDGAFADRTEAAGLGAGGWSSSAALADADGDGDLDLYVSRYVLYDPAHDLFCGDPESGERRYCDPSLFAGAGDLYYRNRGDGRFEDATLEAGLAGADGRGLGVLFVDLDGDLRPEIYVANDLTINLLFHNLGDGRFEDLSLLSGTAVNREGKPEAGMGLAVGDLDGDLDPDLVVTNFDVETNTLYRHLGGLVFEDASAVSGVGPVSFNRLAFGVVAADLEGDGDLDLYVANGHIFERPRRESVAYEQPDQILLGDGRGRFEELRCGFLDSRRTVARGLAAADYDNDGDPDLATQANDGPLTLLRNDSPAAGWAGVDLRGAGANTAAVGARIELAAAGGRQVRWVLAGGSYQSSSDRRALFGRGGESVEEVEITWPSGRRQRLLGPPADRYLVVRESPPSE